MTHQMSFGRTLQTSETSSSGVTPKGSLWVTALIWLFYLALISPVFLDLGQFSFPPYRVVLIIALGPCFLMWASGRLGPVRATDFLFLIFALWVAVAITKVHGLSQQYQFIGFTTIDTLGGYFLGRAAIRNAKNFLDFVKLHFLTLLVLLPFAILETRTGDPTLIRVMQPFIRTQPVISYEPRLGLERAQVVFQHPILFGVYAAGTLGLVIYALGHTVSRLRSTFRFLVVAIATICSVSSGAVLALLLQIIFSLYEFFTAPKKWRWRVVAVFVVLLYIGIDLLSDRTPVHVFISYLTLNSSTGYNRIQIWIYGTQNVAAHPIFGLGLKDWVRPRWMVPSVDNFWLLIAMRYGYPGIILYLGAFLVLLRALSLKKDLSPQTAAIRAGALISFGGVMVAACTVNLWGPIYAWLMFFTGSVLWILEEDKSESEQLSDEHTDPMADRGIKYSRFAQKKPPPGAQS